MQRSTQEPFDAYARCSPRPERAPFVPFAAAAARWPVLIAALVALLLAACGGDDQQVAAKSAPAIASFAATPAAQPVGGGAATLSWSVLNATMLTIDNGTVRYVDVAAGADTNACSQAAPCKTLAKALTAPPAGSTIFLADGVYSRLNANNPNLSPVTVPDGITLQAVHLGAATLASLGVTVLGSATGATAVPCWSAHSAHLAPQRT